MTEDRGRADPASTVVGFARTLRAAGVDAGPDRVLATVEALAVLDAERLDDTYWAGRFTLCSSDEDVACYDVVFDAYFSGESPHRRLRRGSALPERRQVAVPVGEERPAGAEDVTEDSPVLRSRASRAEVLRHRDIAALDLAEREELARILAAFRLPGALRRTRRRRPSPTGEIDRRRTVRALLAAGGEPTRLHRQVRRVRPRRVVLLIDVSGSMSPYADSLLRFAHAASRREGTPTEVFTIGTRLTRVTRELALRDADAAMAEVASAVRDWRGGTRLGELLKEFLDGWGQRGMARGAVVVVLSDGWERGDANLLGEQMERLARLAHTVVWANPRKGRSGYEPLVAGMVAALPHVDAFVAGHSLAALQRLARVVAGVAAGDRLPTPFGAVHA
jgi:uncharacterized protein with von Willebrand factor type A (vWA) domain